MAMSYSEALKAGKKVGAGKAEGDAMLALFCDGVLPYLHPAASGKLVYEGAVKSGLSYRDVAHMDAASIDNLMWL